MSPPQNIDRNDLWSLALLAVLVVLVRAVVFQFDKTQIDIAYDIDRWVETARNIISGHGYSLSPLGYDDPIPTAMRGPTVVFFFTAVLWLFGDHVWSILIAQWLIDAGTAVVLFFIALEMFRDRRVAFIGSLLFAFYLPGLIFTFRGWSEPVFTLVLAGFSLSLLKALRQPSLWRFAMSGGLLGLATMARPIMQFYPLVLLPVLFWALGYERRRALANCAVLSLAFAAVLLPWIVRNYLVFDALIPGSTHSGKPLFESNFALPRPDYLRQRSSEDGNVELRKVLEARFGPTPSDTASERIARVRHCERHQPGAKREPLFRSDPCAGSFELARIAQANGIDEFELNKIATQEVIKAVQAHPERYLLVSVVRFFRLWFHHRFVNFVIHRGTLPKAWVVAAVNGSLLGLAFLGVMRSRLRWSPSAILFMALFAYSSLVYAATQSVGRYSVPLMPYVIVFAAYGLVSLFAKAHKS